MICSVRNGVRRAASYSYDQVRHGSARVAARVQRVAVPAGRSLVSALRLACVAVVTLVVLAGDLLAQTTGTTGGDPQEFDTFPEFFNFTSLVTNGVAYLAAMAVVILAAVIGWRMTMKGINMFTRRVG